MHQHDLLEALIGPGPGPRAQEGRQAGAGGEQVEVFARVEVVQHQVPVGFLLTTIGSPGRRCCKREVRGRPVPDAEEPEMLVVVGAGDAVGARRLAAVQADHHELAVLEAQPGSRVVRS